MNSQFWRTLKWGSLTVSIGSVVVAAVLMWLHSETGVVSPDEQQAQDQSNKPQTKVEKALIVERKGERIIWRLQADEANQHLQSMELKQPKLEMFTESGEVVPIRGRSASFEPLKRNIHFKGDVVVNYQEWVLTSQELRYESGLDQVRIPGRFKAQKPGITLHGRGLRVDRKSQRLTVDHDVWVEDATRTLGLAR